MIYTSKYCLHKNLKILLFLTSKLAIGSICYDHPKYKHLNIDKIILNSIPSLKKKINYFSETYGQRITKFFKLKKKITRQRNDRPITFHDLLNFFSA